MFINTFLLALSSSIDSLGIGVTYGLRHTKLLKKSKVILFFISFFITLLSGIVGNILKSTLSTNICEFIGSAFLLCMGIFIIIQSNEQEISFDFDNSNDISPKESILLGIALSLDSLCIGIGGSTIGINIYLFSFLVAILQCVFLSIGNYCGIHLIKFSNIPQGFWSKISGVLLILIGLIKF